MSDRKTLDIPQTYDRRALLKQFWEVRLKTEDLCRSLQIEDFVIQSMPDVSPTKWHLGHTSWFFEAVILSQFLADFQPYHERYWFFFNSYYESVGARVARNIRGLMSRPTVRDVYAYRSHINEQMDLLVQTANEKDWENISSLIILGIHHEQQHQELLLTDIKHVLSINPLRPAYRSQPVEAGKIAIPDSRFLEFEEGLFEMGDESSGFSFDNERPRHRVWMPAYRLQNRLITNREYLEFMNDGGYSDYRHWLSDGWATIQEQNWNAPFYWEKTDGKWSEFTLSGMRILDLDAPVSHVSYYEADAFAHWSGKRLPTEAEWERAAGQVEEDVASGNFMESERFHPRAFSGSTEKPLVQMFGDVWEWTCSSYLPYPGFRPDSGTISEYNGKFMSDQMVLRGGSCATPLSHIRKTYRNFFQCDKRWQFTGIRLAEDVS